MKLGIILFAGLAFAQTPTLTLTGPSTARPGATVPVMLSFNGTGVVALQWAVEFPSGTTATVSSPVSGKSLTCTASNFFCLLVGPNVAPVPNGQVAAYTVHLPPAASGNIVVTMANLLGASPGANSVEVIAGTAYTIRIIQVEDINGDGSVTAADVALMSDQVIEAQANPAACTNDQNGDGKCDLLDVFRVVIKSLGLI